jgi:hypothetical protein
MTMSSEVARRTVSCSRASTSRGDGPSPGDGLMNKRLTVRSYRTYMKISPDNSKLGCGEYSMVTVRTHSYSINDNVQLLPYDR